jgi:hypothetical protein
MEPLGKVLILLGLATAALGALLWAAGRFFPQLRLGRLPGDIAVERPGASFYFPITTMILASLLLSLVLWIVGALRR